MGRKRRSSFIRFLVRPYTLAVIFAVFLFMSYGYIMTVKRGREIQERVSTLQSDIEELEKRKEELLETKKLTESPEFVEREARSKLGLKKKGEHVIIVPSDTIEPVVQDTTARYGSISPEYQRKSYPMRWISFFFSDR
ncbi:MAG: septum formation initiator family protein [Patescibacteria group bacterium]